MTLKLLELDNVVALGSDLATGARGLLTKGVNRTGAASVLGTLVSLSTTADNEYIRQANEFDTVGVLAESGIAEGAEVWIWKPGSRCQVLFKDGVTPTRGNILIAADTDGRGNSIANPGSGLPAVETHFKECGHVCQSVASGTDVLALCEIHTN
jgi:hypothetical protein